MHLTRARTISSPTPEPRAAHFEHLLRQAGSELERHWLRWLDARGCRLPDRAQVFVESCQTRPDFLYEAYRAAIYIDGPPHDYADRQARDRQQTEAMEDYGYTVIRFSHADHWEQIIARYPNIFGTVQTIQAVLPRELSNATVSELELELFDAPWHALLRELARELSSAMIEPGGDVALGGRVVGRYFARVTLPRSTLLLIDAAEPDIERIKEAITSDGHTPFVVAHEQWPEAVQSIVQMSQER
jgi:very-short-patch-repair endonuclease